jgi:hypothetical protein
MSEMHQDPASVDLSPEERWRRAVIGAARAQRDYDAIVSDPAAGDTEVNRVWLRLYRAQSAQAELLRAG